MASRVNSKFEITRRPDGSVGMALVLPALTDCRWWFESLLVHSGVSSATRRKATGADHKKSVLIRNYCFCNTIERVKRPGGSHEGVGREKKKAKANKTQTKDSTGGDQLVSS